MKSEFTSNVLLRDKIDGAPMNNVFLLLNGQIFWFSKPTKLCWHFLSFHKCSFVLFLKSVRGSLLCWLYHSFQSSWTGAFNFTLTGLRLVLLHSWANLLSDPRGSSAPCNQVFFIKSKVFELWIWKLFFEGVRVKNWSPIGVMITVQAVYQLFDLFVNFWELMNSVSGHPGLL